MPFGKGRRKLLLILGIFLLTVAAVCLSFPLWFPWVLGPVASHFGARFSTYERLGYTRFRIAGLTITNTTIRLGAKQVEAYLPTAWVWRLARAGGHESTPFLQVTDWSCELVPTDKPPRPTASQLQDVASDLGLLQKWVPAADLSGGTIRSGTTIVGLSSATLRKGNLGVRLIFPALLPGRDVSATLTPGRPFKLEVLSTSLSFASKLEFVTNQSGADIKASSIWQSNRFDVQAHFSNSGTLPQNASLTATDFQVPNSLVPVPYYSNLAGSVSAEWREGTFKVSLSAAAHPQEAQTNWPITKLELEAAGDTNSAVVEKLTITSPFLEAALDGGTKISFSPPFLLSDARLKLKADLAQQNWVSLVGHLTGNAEIVAGTNTRPTGHVQIVGTEVGNSEVRARSIELAADLNWPRLRLIQAQARFEDGSEGAVMGECDLERKVIEGGTIRFEGPLVRRWLPTGYSFDSLSVTGTCQGPFQDVTHSGQLKVRNLSLPHLQPLGVEAEWEGNERELHHFNLQLRNSNAVFAAEGSVATSTNQSSLTLQTLSVKTNNVQVVKLDKPLKIDYSGQKATNGWRLATSPLTLTVGASKVIAQAAVDWPREGEAQFSLEHFSPDFLSAFALTNLPHCEIARLKANGAWTNGPLSFEIIGSATVLPDSLKPNRQVLNSSPGPPTAPTQPGNPKDVTTQLLSTPLNVELNLTGNREGIMVSNVVVKSPTSDVAVAHGFIPIVINPIATTNLVNINEQSRIQLNASVRPEAFFWQTVSQLTGVQLIDPVIDLGLTGTWRVPEGKIVASAREIQLKQGVMTNVALSDLRVALELDREKARLVEGQVMVQGQRVSFTGELPMDENAWIKLTHKQLPNWQKASARLEIESAKIAAFEPIFPQVLAPQGELNADLRLLPGADIQGELTLRHARTRPLGNTAPIRDINVTLRFADRILALENATANLSGASVELTGRADLRDYEWKNGGLPPFALTLRGTNVPLAREPEYIIRSDLDLAIAKTNDAAPAIFGTAHLRDSFYLSDLTQLVPGKVSAPASRPPYFSIDNPTVADWRLGVTVEGVRWLKLRTSLFNGEVSANLHLAGTLKDPIALGDLKVDSGLVRFPFANLEIQQGLVTLTSQDPYRPQLLVRAASKQFGYDLRMEVTGSVDSPIIQFTSNPSLSSEQILLMITAGQLPQGSFTLTPQQRAQTVALFLGRDVLAKLGLGDQSQERLTISSGEEISVQNRPTYHVEYKLTPRWSVTGEYDRWGDFNAGLKWRVYSK